MNFFEFIRFVFKTEKKNTIIRDLERIMRLSTPKYRPENMDNFGVIEMRNKIRFISSQDEDRVKEKFSMLKSLRKVDVFMNHSSFEADIDEYNKVYNNSYSVFINSYMVNLYKFLQNNKDNERCILIMEKYKDSIHIVYNTIRKSVELNGYVEDEIREDVIKGVKYFGEAIYKEHKLISDIKEKLEIIERTAHIKELKDEIDYMEKYIEVER